MTLYSNKSIIYNGMLHTSFVIPPYHLSLNEKKASNKQLSSTITYPTTSEMNS